VFWAYAFLAPWIIGLAVFIVGPILFSLGMSTFNYTLGREAGATFIGLGNWSGRSRKTSCSGHRSAAHSCIRRLWCLHRLRRFADGDAAQRATAGTTFYRTVFSCRT